MALRDEILADNPIVYWELAEPSGTTATDTQTGNDGTYSGDVTLGVASPIAGQTWVDFGATSSVVTVPDGADVDLGNGPFTLEMLIQRDTVLANYVSLMEKPATSFRFAILSSADATGPSSLILDSPGPVICQSKMPLDSTIRPYLVACTYNGGTTGLLYINGAEGTTQVGTTTLTDSATALSIGFNPSFGLHFDGKIGHVAIWKSVLTPTRLYAHAAAAGLVARPGSIQPAGPQFVGFGEPGGGILHPRSELKIDSGSTVQNLLRDMAESVTQSDVWTRSGGFVRTTTESVTQSDVWTRLGTFIRTLTESVQSADVWTRIGTFRRTLTESVQQSDVWTRIGTFVRTLTESVQSADVWTRTGTFIRTWSESVTQSDVWNGSKLLVRTMTESVTQSDAWTRTGTFLRTLTESVTQADVWTRTGTFIRSLTESVQSADAWTRLGTFPRSLTSSVTQSDAWTRTGTFVRTWADSVTQADAWVGAKLGAIVRSWTESVQQADVWTRTGTFKRTLTETVAQLDTWVGSKLTGIVGGIGRGFASAVHAVPSAITSHLRPSGGASQAKPSGQAGHAQPKGSADHEVPE